MSFLAKQITYSNYDRVLQSISFEDSKAYFTFVNDPLTYVANKGDGVDIEALKALNLNAGDTFNILLKDTSQRTTYTIIYVLKSGNNVIYDVVESTEKSNACGNIFFGTLSFCFSGILIAMSFCNIEKKQTKECFKEYSESSVLFGFFYFFTGFGVLFTIEFLIFFLTGLMHDDMLAIIIIGLVFAAIGLLGIWACRSVYVAYDGKTYTIRNTFKVHKIDKNSVKTIVTKMYPSQKAFFLNEYSQVVLTINFEYKYFARPLFLGSLQDNNIELNVLSYVKGYSKKTKDLENKTISAINLYENGDYDNANTKFEGLLKENPDLYNAYFTLLTCVYCGRLQRAEEIFNHIDSFSKRSFLMNKNVITCHYIVALVESKHIDEAMEKLNNLLALEKKNRKLKKNLLIAICSLPFTDEEKANLIKKI